MKTFKQILEEMYVCKRVKITIGHPSNYQHIVAKVVDIEHGSGGSYEENLGTIILILKDIEVFDPAYSQSLRHMMIRGLFDKHQLRLDTEISILREENLNKLIG